MIGAYCGSIYYEKLSIGTKTILAAYDEGITAAWTEGFARWGVFLTYLFHQTSDEKHDVHKLQIIAGTNNCPYNVPRSRMGCHIDHTFSIESACD